MFKSLDFTYDGKSSTDYGLVLASLGKSGTGTAPLGVPFIIEEAKVKSNPKPFFYGVEVGPKLSFEVEMIYISPDPNKPELTRQTIASILKWLLKKEYKEFRVIDEDYSNIIYNCIFTEPEQIQYDNSTYGLKFTVVCDRPYGFRKQTITKQITTSGTINISNLGFYNDDIYPEIEIQMGAGGGNISLVNTSDGNRNFAFTGLAGNEIVYVNNQRQEIYSSNSVNRNTNFNFNWFRIAPKPVNAIAVTGTATITFRIEFPMPM